MERSFGMAADSMTAEDRLAQLGIKLPAPPEPFGMYAEAVQTDNLLFLTGMLPTQGRVAAFIGRVGAELDVDTGRKAAHLAALNVLAVARQHLGSLDRVTRIVRLGVMVATSGDVRDQPKLADAASEFMGRVGAEFDMEAGSKAARLVALNALAAARNHLGLFLLASSDCVR